MGAIGSTKGVQKSQERVFLEFDFMHKDTICTHVRLTFNLDVEVTNFTDDWTKCAFGRADVTKVTHKMLMSFLEDRCFPRTRANCDELLRLGGFTEYDPIALVKKSRGVMLDDLHWVRFDYEKHLKWLDVAPDWRK